MNLLKTLIFTILVPGTVTILIPRWLLAAEQSEPIGVFRFIGLIPLSIGVAIYLWCAWDFATAGKGTPAVFAPPKRLVVHGLYKFVRNPMYVGILSILFGEALLLTSPFLFGYAVLMTTNFHCFVVWYEEPALTKKFGEEYRQYLASVPRWLPSFNNRAERSAQ